MRRLSLLAGLSLAAMLVFASVAFAQSRGPSGADGTFNCEDFDTQQQAQAFLEEDPSDPDGLDADDDGLACESLPNGMAEDGTMMGGGTGNGGAMGGAGDDLNCIDFATQGEAQANLDANPSDPNNLDADNDGIACEEPVTPEESVTEPVGESAAIAENAPTPPAFEVQPNGDVIIGGDVVLVDGCSMPTVLGDTPLSQGQLQQALAQCEELGFSAQQTTPADGNMTALPDTGGPALLLPVAGLALAGLGVLGLGVSRRRRSE